MQKKHLICTFVIIADLIVMALTAGPSWNTPSSTTLSKTSSECTGITSLDASSTDGSSVVYSLFSQDPNGNFVVDDNPLPPFGKLLQCTQASIIAPSYSVVVRAAHDGGNNEYTDLTLTISFTDVVGGGEAPVFVNPDPNSLEFEVLETIQAGDTILTLSATDADSDDATLTFNMNASPSETTDLFEIDGNLLKVKAGVATDYFDVEDVSTLAQFRINLEVSDGSTSTTLETNINIQDVNDNSPVFSGSTSASIGENVPEGYTVLTVTAMDNDKTTANNQVTLSLAEISEFHLEGDKIKVSAGVNFDASTKSSYQLTITASDNVQDNPRTTSQGYEVLINAAPEFVDPDPDKTSDSHDIYMCESIEAGDEIMTLTATDTDSDDASLEYDMDKSNSTITALFEVVGNKLMVKAGADTSIFDYDTDDAVTEYDITLEVSDGVSTTSITTTIRIEDDNDNAPEFSGDTAASVLDSSPAGTSVLILTATDGDKSAEYKNISFSLSGATDFEIGGDNSDTIVVANGASFDYASKSSYTLIITASDNAPEEAQTTDQNITVTITSAPEFVEPDPDESSELHDIYMCESIQAGDEVMTLGATDKDSDDASLTFSMDTSNSTLNALFEVDGNKLKVNASADTSIFDFDTDNAVTEYDITLKVSDGALKTTLTTTIRIEDDNDNAPVFSGDTTATVLDSSPAGTSVLILTATDGDKSAEYKNISFSLSATEFGIGGDNSDTIVVANRASFNYSSKSSYTLTITASDNAPEEAQTTDQTITVTITTEPKFNKLNSAQTASVDENAATSTEIYVLDVTDEDGTGTLTVSISAQPSPEMFILDGQKLKLKAGADLDADQGITSYQLEFNATDGTYEVESAVLTVTVNELNDNPPVFTESNPVVNIAEKTTGGSIIYDVNATDADVGNENNVMIFSMTETDTNHFSINENTGIISLKQGTTLIFSNKAEYQLIVTAKDGSLTTDNSASTTVTVNIFVPPAFTDPTDGNSLSIAEDSDVGLTVKNLTASDADGDTPTFTLLSQDPALPAKFKVEGSDIVTTETFDVDVTGAVTSYTLELSVSDGRSYTNNETIKITVTIDDSNTKSPTFDPAEDYELNVKETEAVGVTVLIVTATDDDLSDPNNVIKYSMTGTAFSIDADSGNITVSASLSYDTKSEYNLTVTAKDTGNPPKSSTQQVKITILAEPKFNNLTVAKSKDIDENLPADTSVYAIAVTDGDSTWDGTISIVSQTPNEMFKMKGTILETKTDGLDAETETTYVLKFKVTDGPFVVESANLTLNILDLNDNPPVIAPIIPVDVDENMTIGAFVYDVEASDIDVTAPNNALSYSITAGNDDEVFAIDAENGTITLSKTLSLQSYNLEVTVTDGDSTAQVAAANVSIYVDANVVDECLPEKCQNGGTCSSSVNVYTCQCVPGYIGNNCETDKNECDPQPCMNNGTCIDAVNYFSCNCTEGWHGTTCTDGCTNNTYGRNCQEQCNCNASRLIPNVANEQCDIKTGACKCNNTNWIGYSCEDKDECEDSSLCKGLNFVCENTVGSYYCTCQQGYKNSSSDLCEYVLDNSTVTIYAQPGESIVAFSIVMDTDCPNLTIPSVYNETKLKIKISIQETLSAEKKVVVVNVWCGSLSYDSLIVIDKEDARKLANEISNISNTVEYDGKMVPVKEIKVNSSTVDKTDTNAQRACDAYIAIEQCAGDYVCIYENGLPSCGKVGEDNTGLILGLGLGVCLPLIVLAIIAAAYLYRWVKRQKRRESSPRRKGSWRKEESPWYGRMKQNGFKIDTKHYNRNLYNEKESYINSAYDTRHYYDMPGLGYTSI